VSDALPPQLPPLPPLPPPPPLPPAPQGYSPRSVIRWGVGDIFWGILLYLAGGVAASIVLIATGAIEIDTSSGGSIGELSVGAIALSLVAGWIGFVGWPIVATYRKGQRSLAKDFGLEIRWIDLAWGVLGGIAAIAASIAGGMVWRVVTGEDTPSNGAFLPEHPGVAAGLVLWVLIAVLTPIAEELFFRGLMLRAIGRRWSLPIAVVVSSLVFGSFHFDGGNGIGHGLFIVAVTASYGAVFAMLVVRSGGRLGPSIIAHSCVNTLGVIALFVT
jgi:membrane protease YdiL (CAAX protease family)